MKYLASVVRKVISYAALAAVVFAAALAKPAASDDQRIAAVAPE